MESLHLQPALSVFQIILIEVVTSNLQIATAHYEEIFIQTAWT